MPKYQIVIDDADTAFAGERARGHAHAKRAKGTIHAEAVASECPEGRPNCRNCGDPAHAAHCQAKGHCPDCGTKHGIAPDAVVKKNGYILVELP